MYCPGCGSEERQISQYCRACGTDLRVVRASLERPDAITESAVTAREQIGRAVAEKIREVDDARDLRRVAEDVLPQIEKFLESPEEKRLRRMRAGVITAAVGLGAGIPSVLIILVLNKTDEALPFLGMMFILSLVTFMIGLGLVINGRMLTQPRKELKDNSADAQAQIHLDEGYAPPQLRPGAERPDHFRSPTTSDLAQAELRAGSSVTEHTTQHLKREQ
jgi:hypothetical protein